MPSPNWSQRALAAIFAPDFSATDLTLPEPGLLAGPALPIVTPAGSGFGVSIAPAVWVLAGSAPATTGGVLWAPPGFVTASLSAAHPTLARHDLITLQVTDPGTSSTSGSSDAVVVQGTPASSPADPSVPTGALVIARVNVRAGTSSIVQNDITQLINQVGLRDNAQADPGWEVTGLAQALGTWAIPNNSESRYPGLTVVEAKDVTVVANPASATITVPGSYQLAFSGIYIAAAPPGSANSSSKWLAAAPTSRTSLPATTATPTPG
jgi:hypothetical protein